MIRITVSLLLAAVLGLPLQDARKDGNTAFGIELHKILKPSTENQFFSPISITAALGMAEAGARKQTADQMRKAVQLSEDPKRHELLGKLIRGLSGKTRKDNGYELAVANRLWPQKGLALDTSFVEITKTHYDATTEGLDFKTDPEASRVIINKWIEKQTRDRIKDLLPAGTVDPLTRVILTNAIYFKGDWDVQFDKAETKDADFFTGAETPVKVPLMFRSGKMAYGETPEAQVVELPFKSKEISMVFILPRDKAGLAKWEAGLTVDSLGKMIAAIGQDVNVQLHLPRFKMESMASLNSHLAKLGMVDAFDPARADFSGITAEDKLYITSVVHKAFVEVNEEGAEAAAATGATFGVESKPVSKEFRADHPFLFLIRDVKTGTILFMGRLVKP